MYCQRVSVLGLLLLLVWVAPVMALKSDRQQTMYIESDELEVDDLRGISVYRGSVRFSQGSLQLQADKVVVTARQRRLQKVVAHGRPVRLQRQMDQGRGKMRAEAQTMEYRITDDSLILLGNAKLWQGGNEFSGDQIEYHLQDETIVARSDKTEDGRVRIIIQPSKRDKPEPVEPASTEPAAAASRP